MTGPFESSSAPPSPSAGSGFIRIEGAREHNLQNISVAIPRDRLVVITGVSGSGKSSLAFDTIYAEGQRRYVESLSAYARQFLGLMEKPDVDLIEGLSPAISIEQKTTHKNPRSTVGTVTEIYDYLRLLYARAGEPHCPSCRRKVSAAAVDQIVEQILEFPPGTRLQILAPLVQNKKGEHRELIAKMIREGFTRLRINGEAQKMEKEIKLAKNRRHTIELIVDRIIMKERGEDSDLRSRLTDSLETALLHGNGVASVFDGQQDRFFSQKLYCSHCSISLPELNPRSFSFNSPLGACRHCDGLGVLPAFEESLLIADGSLSLLEGAIAPWSLQRIQWYAETIHELAEQYGFDPHSPWNRLPAKARRLILHGSESIDPNAASASPSSAKIRSKKDQSSQKNRGSQEDQGSQKDRGSQEDQGSQKDRGSQEDQGSEERRLKERYRSSFYFEGLIPNFQRRYRETKSDEMRTWLKRYMIDKLCPSCKGSRLKAEFIAVLYHQKNIADLCSMNIEKLSAWFASLKIKEQEQKIAGQILKELQGRLNFLNNVGVGYLALARQAGTLSGGETQRIRLATQIGSSLMGVIYILDEPSIGLHQRDNARLLATLKGMRDLGNTVIVVEHDEDTIRSADQVVDVGIGAGSHGGRIIAQGAPQEVAAIPESLTGQYLKGERYIPVPRLRRKGNGKLISVQGAKANNLKGIDVEFPLGKFICITGVSGSGKSTLVNEVLYKGVVNKLQGYRGRGQAAPAARLKGISALDRVIAIDQEPIGRTPRSNPATYTGLFTPVRELFSSLPEARLRGYRPGRFSFNVSGGRCENCQGAGIIKIEMHFLPDVYITCEVCSGHRFNRETLEVRYKGKSIYDLLEMTVEEALLFFENITVIRRKLETMAAVGLEYIKLGQPATTLSGGEAQRVKLSTELARTSSGSTLYILDEPTTGLHFEDISRLLKVLHNLVDRGNSMVVIEHNMDVIKTADHLIDLGPEGGDAGGKVIATGTPEELALMPESHTGLFLRDVIKRAQYADRIVDRAESA